jgi:A/G-specific adenine glycosylase
LSDFFTLSLLDWFEDNARSLPWKNTKDPYIIWISEIILQQTRVSQGTPFFLRFVEKFPDVFTLASATEDQVLKYWEGLGYYSRARNLHHTAQHIVNKFNGVFPDTYESLLSLRGVGPYTAAAIASFAFDQPHAVVDGNVYRVLARYYGIQEPIDEIKVKKQVSILANNLIDPDRPADFNQAMMDFGATICTPDNPLCLYCSLRGNCSAYNKGLVKVIPIKAKKITKRERFLHYILVREQDHLYITKRKKGIWKGLYELPTIEQNQAGQLTSFKNQKVVFIKKMEHLLTHQKLHLYFYDQLFTKGTLPEKYIRINIKDRSNFSFPKPIGDFLKDLF